MTVRIQNLINELHHKTARYLVDNFDVILLPDFKTSGMVTRSQRRIRSKTVRNLLSFAHQRFRNFPETQGFGGTAGRCLSSTRPTPQRQ